jgi:Tol biopolymer transport system component
MVTGCLRNADLERALRLVEASSTFERSAGLLKLLRFLLESAEADPSSLKEIYVGMVFYERGNTYDPRFDSLVRVNVSRLRKLLKDYSQGEGAGDPGFIEIPKGSYLPIYRRAKVLVDAEPSVEADAIEVADEDRVVDTVPVFARLRTSLVQGGGHWRAIAIATVAVIAVLWLGFRWYRFRKGPPAFVGVALTEIPITMGRELEFEPATSADGQRLAYVSLKRGDTSGSAHFQIFLRSTTPDARAEQALETGPEDALYPTWSPDGQQIAFLRCGIGPCEIATVPVAGGEVRQVRVLPRYSLPDDMPYYQYRQLNPVWTKDGRSVIFPYRGLDDDAERLVQFDLKTKAQRQLTSGAVADEDGAPAISPDGRSVAFLRRHLSTAQVMIVDLKTLETNVLTSGLNYAASGLTWSPDGRGVVVGVNHNAKGTALLWVPLHGVPRELATNFPVYINPVFSANGKSLMVLKVNRSRDLNVVIGQGKPEPLFRSRQRNAATALSADGRSLVFITDRSGSYEVWLAQRKGDGFLPPRQLTHGLGFFPLSISWAPDGKTLAVGISNTNRVELVDVATGLLGLLPLRGLDECLVWSPVWSADSKSIYLAVSGARSGLFRAPVDGSASAELIAVGTPREVRVDGDRAVYFTPEFARGVYKVSLLGDARPELIPQLRDVLPDRAWTVTDGKLYYFDVHDAEHRFRTFDPSSGDISAITGGIPRVSFGYGNPSYDPNTRLLIYSGWSEAAGSQIVELTWP